jgi:hypothetical protein
MKRDSKEYITEKRERKKKKSNYTVEKSDKHDISQVIKVNINSDSVQSIYP